MITKKVADMVLMSDGCLDQGTQVWTEGGNLISERHLFTAYLASFRYYQIVLSLINDACISFYALIYIYIYIYTGSPKINATIAF